MTGYNHEEETKKHIELVRARIIDIISALEVRASLHDYSKLIEPEKGIFEEHGTELETVIYGTKNTKIF